MAAEPASGEGDATRDTLLDGRIVLHQPARGHRAGTDAVLLAAAITLRGDELVVDVGAGCGAVGLMLAARAPRTRIVLVERDPRLAGLGARNISENGLAARGLSLCADVFAGLPVAQGGVDVVATNPPFFDTGDTPLSPDPARAAAHALAGGRFADWIDACARLLRPRGRLALIQRGDKLPSCLAALGPRFGAIRITPVHPRADADATRVVVTAVKNARTPTSLSPPFVLHEPDGRFTERAARAHGEGVWG